MDSSVISILNTSFWVCLSFAILFFLISIVLFFVFDIRTIFNIKTGRAQAKTVKEMKAANESTGRLRVDGKTQTSKLTNEGKDTDRAPAVAPPGSQETNQQYSSGSEETEVLFQNPSWNVNNMNYAETSVLSSNMTDEFNGKNDLEAVNNINFRIVKKTVLIHTGEIIQ